MNTFLEQLQRQPFLVDGAMGTMLYARGVPVEQCLERLVIDRPEWVMEIHSAYAEAGADVITSHTFGANRMRLAHYGLEDRVVALNSAAVRLAREVRERTERTFYIAGNVGPVGKRVEWGNARERLTVADAFREQIGALAGAGVDLLLFETFSDVTELEVAIQVAQELCEVPLLASMSFGDDGLTLAGQGVAEATTRMLAAGVEIIGTNCSVGPGQLVETLKIMRQIAPTALISVTPNAGLPVQNEAGQLCYPLGAAEFAGYVTQFLELGARMVGGCCGTTPEYTALMRRVLDSSIDTSRLPA